MYIIFCVRPLQVCSFYYTGQYQSLHTWNGQQYRPHVFYIPTNRQREGPAASYSIMTIAKGRTNCKAERDIVHQGFCEQLEILKESQQSQENIFKAHLYDIITDYSISNEEKSTLKNPWIQQLQELEERHIRIMRSMFIGLYSFWEVSLMNIVETHISSCVDLKKSTSNKSKKMGVEDYLKQIYGKNYPTTVEVINKNIRELRNYLVHGSLNTYRQSLINDLANNFPEMRIQIDCGEYYISDYSGLYFLLELFTHELDNAENSILATK